MESIEPKRYAGLTTTFDQNPFGRLLLILWRLSSVILRGAGVAKWSETTTRRGKLEKLLDELLKDSLDDKARDGLSRIHPTFMGGEYLPNYRRQEVEIARISLESTTSDVISLRARPAGSRIKYHLVDEYQTEFGLSQKTSSRPFSLRELIGFLDSVEHPQADLSWKRFGFVLSFNQCNLDCGTDLETLRDFTSVSSDYYPGLAPLRPGDGWMVFCPRKAASAN